MRLYHVGFMFRPSIEKHDRITRALNTVSTDWMYYSSHCYIAYAESADRVHIAVREAIDPDDQFLVLPIDMTAPRQGLLSSWIWRWLDIDRTRPGWVDERNRIRDELRPPPPLPPSLAELFAQYKLGKPPES